MHCSGNAFFSSVFGVASEAPTPPPSGTEVFFGTPNASPVANSSDSTFATFITLSGLLANTEYHIHVEGTYTTSSGGIGIDFGINADVAPASLAAQCIAIRTGTACAYGSVSAVGSIAATTSGSTSSQPFFYTVTLTTGASVTAVEFQVRVFPTDTGTVTVAAGVQSHYYIQP